MADKNNQNLNEDGWNDGSNYDRIQNLLQDVDSTKADAKVALTGAERKKFTPRRSSRYQKSRRVGSKSSSTSNSIAHSNNDPNKLNNVDEDNSKNYEEEIFFKKMIKKFRIFYRKLLQNVRKLRTVFITLHSFFCFLLQIYIVMYVWIRILLTN